MEKQNRESHCVQGSGIFLVGAGDRRQPYLSPVRCSSGMFSALNEKTGTRSRIGLIQFYYNWEEDKKYLLVEIYLAKQKQVQYNINENTKQSAERPQQCGFSKIHKLARTNRMTPCSG